MNKETVRRQFSNAVEYLYEKGIMNFPKSLETSKQFKVKSFKHDAITFDIYEDGKNLGGFVIFTAWELSYDKVKEGNETFAMKYFVTKMCKDMYRYHLLQLT